MDTQNSNQQLPENITFMSVNEFKAATGVTTFRIAHNPATKKMASYANTGKVFKAQQDIDVTQDISVLIPNNELDNACFVNVKNQLEVAITL